MKNVFLFLFCIIHFVSYAQDSTLTKKQKSIFEILKNKRMPKNSSAQISLFRGENPSTLFTVEDYDHPILKKEVVRLLSPKFTDEELNALSRKYINPQDIDRYTKQVLKIHPHRVYKQVYDSIVSSRMKINISEFLEQGATIDRETVELAGYLYLREAIPSLQEILKKGNNWYAKLALARMEVEPYYSEILLRYDPVTMTKNIKVLYKDSIKSTVYVFKYLATQEALQRIEKYLYMDNPCEDSLIPDEYPSTTYTTIAKQAIFELQKANFPVVVVYGLKDKETRLRFDNYNTDEELLSLDVNTIGTSRNINEVDIQYFKKYFKENKGKIKVNKYWY